MKRTLGVKLILSLFQACRMGFKDKDLKKIKSNVGVSYALYDEGVAKEMKNGNLEYAPEILRLINRQSNKDYI